ncbi:hypothetical protein GCM10018952_35320 [Streptosporangium vulgare]
MAGVLEERAAIEREIAGRTVCGQLKEAAESNPDAPAYSDPVEGGWSTLTYSQARQRVLEIAAGFAALGLEPGEAVALMMVNRSEHVLADLGAVHAGAVSCSVYSTFAPEQVAFVAGDVAARIAVLGGPADLARWEPVLDELPGLRKVIVLEGAPAGDRFISWDDFLALGRETLAADPAAVDARWQAVTADDVLTVLYTSGTTGNPKGVPLTHANVFFEVVATNRMAELPSNGTQISYLTYAHIAERVLSLYLPLFKFSPHPLLHRPRPARRHPRPGQAGAVLRGAARVGEDDGPPAGAAGHPAGGAAGGRAPGDGRRARLRRGQPVRTHPLARDPRRLRAGRRRAAVDHHGR